MAEQPSSRPPPSSPSEPAGAQRVTGIGRLLVGLYALFAAAATSRAGVQLAQKFDEAPLAYTLSAVSALVYLLATVAIARSGGRWHRVAVLACTFELAGVLVVGTASLLFPASFPDQTVWSQFGLGYLLIPLVLPVLGLTYLRLHPSA